MTTACEPIRILIADDHPVFREGLVGIIGKQADMTVAGEACDGVEAVERHRELRPDITLMDLQMPRMDGVEAITAIRAADPSARIIVLTTYSGDVKALRALRAGAEGYMLKSAVRTDLLEGIRTVHQGARHIPADVATQIAVHAIDDALTSRETDILALVAAGNANKQIAWKLSISEDTVKTHLRSIFHKLRVTDRTHAVTIAAKRGILDL